MTWSFPSLLRRFTAAALPVLCLSSCALEKPAGFWTDTPRDEHALHSVPAPPVPKKPGPVGLNVTYLRGYVRTPFTHPPRLVDVRGLLPGTLVICPFTQKLFNLPLDFVDAYPRRRPPAAPVYHLIPREPAPARQAPASTPVAAPVFRDHNAPYGIAIPSRPGFVYSPYADRRQMVDVTGLAPGMEVKCPYTGQLFRVPAAK